jgi:hypothetical protein
MLKPGSTRRTERLLLLLGILALVGIGAWLWRLEPEEAGTAADILGMVVSGVGVLVAIMLRPTRPSEGEVTVPEPGATGAARPAPTAAQKRWRIIFAGILVVLLAGLGGTIWRYASTSAITITGAIELQDNQRLGDGAKAVVVLPGDASKRNYLTLVPVITNVAATGDCVDPARLVVTSVVDGRPADSVVVRSGQPARVRIGDAARSVVAWVTVDQSAGDPTCEVDLHIDRAFVHG